MRIWPSVTSGKRFDIYGVFFISDVLSCLTSNNFKATHDNNNYYKDVVALATNLS